MISPIVDTVSVAGGQPLPAHTFAPRRPAGVVAYFHPGAFTSGDPTWGHRFADQHLDRGLALVSLTYRHAGNGVTIADQIDDVMAGLNHAAARFDTLPLVVSGHSAGGFLGLWATLRPECPPVVGASLLAPVVRIGANFAHLLPPGIESSVFDLTVAAPADPHPGQFVPIVIVHGSADDLVPISGSEQLVDAWRSRGLDAGLIEIAGADHFFNTAHHASAAEHALADAAADLASR